MNNIESIVKKIVKEEYHRMVSEASYHAKELNRVLSAAKDRADDTDEFIQVQFKGGGEQTRWMSIPVSTAKKMISILEKG